MQSDGVTSNCNRCSSKCFNRVPLTQRKRKIRKFSLEKRFKKMYFHTPAEWTMHFGGPVVPDEKRMNSGWLKGTWANTNSESSPEESEEWSSERLKNSTSEMLCGMRLKISSSTVSCKNGIMITFSIDGNSIKNQSIILISFRKSLIYRLFTTSSAFSKWSCDLPLYFTASTVSNIFGCTCERRSSTPWKSVFNILFTDNFQITRPNQRGKKTTTKKNTMCLKQHRTYQNAKIRRRRRPNGS